MQKEHHEQCRDYYQSVFQNHLKNSGSKEKAFDACLHRFLNQSPKGKNLTAKARAYGLATTELWKDSKTISDSALASLALSKVLHYDDFLPTQLADQLASQNPDTLRWAIRYSGLFERTNSPVWLHLRSHCTSQDWNTFFDVCDRLLEQLQPFDLLIKRFEQPLQKLSLLELLSYLSVIACSDMLEESSNKLHQQWNVYDRIIQRKLKSCSPRDFQLNDKIIGKSLKRHLSSLLFPSNSGWRESSHQNIEDLACLIAATSERIDYEDSIDWFRFDPLCAYQMAPGESVIYNISDAGTREWEKTGHKSDLLWNYWINRAMEAFVSTDLVLKTIGLPENHEGNQLAYIKAIRSRLQLGEVYGLDDHITLNDGTSVPLFQLLLASELSSQFFEQSFIQPLQKLARTTQSTTEALSILAFDGFAQGENRLPITWSTTSEKAKRIKGWTVCDEYPNGSIAIADAIIKFWSNDLKSLTPKKNPRISELPYSKIGHYIFQFPWVAGKQNNLTSAVNNLRRLGTHRGELQEETRRVEQRLGESFKQRGFKVVVGYHPPTVGNDNPGEIDLICHLDGNLLLLEVKSGYIRRSRKEVWLHKTSTLRKAAWQLNRKREALITAIQHDEKLKLQLGYTSDTSYDALHCWIVDTSIELDGQCIEGFPVVSREVLEVVLRDEKHLLSPLNELDLDKRESLFPNGFSASHFIDLVESDALWNGL
ncbi:NERD domain-containing protein [Neptunomonas qingdaonensis]|uniref:NERD domain-containing protein n=1 Tax=Neptunomonas qingdaonensis TaxID=1045558 RepID=A0A1I2U2P7_9GAMM|nr:NERD domain-containing protein [Neptunomonas qingdaonensis]SFG68851.1 hypothetical protein SAMN05216175_11139 [Neptunomonas qingdaonensis]